MERKTHFSEQSDHHLSRRLLSVKPDLRISLPKKGDVLYFQGDESQYLYIVSSGRLLTVMESPTGDPIVWEQLGPFDAVGAFALLMEFPYPATCRADAPSEVLAYSRLKVWNCLETDRLFRDTLMKEMGERFQTFLSRLLFSQKSLEARISMSLLTLSGQAVKQNPDLKGPISLDVTRSILASMSLTTVESAIRITKKWQARGLLDFPKPGKIRILDPEAFKGMTGD